jgi:hypothetical protein
VKKACVNEVYHCEKEVKLIKKEEKSNNDELLH